MDLHLLFHLLILLLLIFPAIQYRGHKSNSLTPQFINISIVIDIGLHVSTPIESSSGP
jgi:hypothetical protein